jgi:hypothetical protein
MFVLVKLDELDSSSGFEARATTGTADSERMKTNPCSVGTGRWCDQARYEFNCRVGGGGGGRVGMFAELETEDQLLDTAISAAMASSSYLRILVAQSM